MANWLASALPVADAVSFEFDDINVTAQRVMTQTATLMAACSPFTTSSSKTIVVVKFLPRDAMHKRGLCCHAVSVCPSVTFVSCAKK